MEKAKIKKKVTNKKIKNKVVDELYVNFVLDETGSMSMCRDATISGFNEYIKTLKSKAKNVKFTLTKFNSSRIETVCKAIDISDVKEITIETYVPNDMTPLYDAVAKTIKDTELAAKGKDVLCVIMTDGQENSSKEYTRATLSALIKSKENDKWAFVYLGANQDSWAIGQSLGLSKGNVVNYATANMKAAMGYIGSTTAVYASMCSSSRATNTANVFADKDEKEKELTS